MRSSLAMFTCGLTTTLTLACAVIGSIPVSLAVGAIVVVSICAINLQED